MAQAGDWSWERYSPLLKLQFRQLQLDPRLKAELEASDVVQDTFLKAIEKLNQFHGQGEGGRIKWLIAIARTTAIDLIREKTAKKKDVRRNQSIDAALAESSARWDKFLGTDDGRPDQEAERREFLVRLAAAMEKLPDDQRDAVLLLHLMGGKLAEAAVQLERSETAVSKLLRRGLDKLAELLPEYKPSNP
jgi:RNA polymerase sigma-70 factor (ECF subfamily)